MRAWLSIFFLWGLSACGTTYEIPDASRSEVKQAQQIFSEERQHETTVHATKSAEELARQFANVVLRVEPVSEQFCREEMAQDPEFICDIIVMYDGSTLERNAYQLYDEKENPIIVFTIPMIADARNEDEIAFILGHEVGHHIGQHIQKGDQQALVGALILGAITAVGHAYANQANPYRDTSIDQLELNRSIAAGYALGQRAFSQTYELEADVIGTYIAKTAGYDPVRGARYFARPEPVKTVDGRLSFWGTHPPDEERLATVLATVKNLEKNSRLKSR